VQTQKTEALDCAFDAHGGNIGSVGVPGKDRFSCSENRVRNIIRSEFFDAVLQLEGMDVDLCDRLDHCISVMCELSEGLLVLFELLGRE
jgi:hypothetical protein